MLPPITLLTDPEYAEKITIIEGPDGVGKTYLVNAIREACKERGIDLRVVRCPDNRGQARFRDTIMSPEIGLHPSAQMFLFIADMLHAFESIIQPELDNPQVRFVFDRFLPSTCIYQKTPLLYINQILTDRYPEFTEAFSDARYIYLSPKDFDAHKNRLSQKHGDEINHLDPVGDEAIRAQIRAYWEFAVEHREKGLLGSYWVDTHLV